MSKTTVSILLRVSRRARLGSRLSETAIEHLYPIARQHDVLLPHAAIRYADGMGSLRCAGNLWGEFQSLIERERAVLDTGRGVSPSTYSIAMSPAPWLPMCLEKADIRWFKTSSSRVVMGLVHLAQPPALAGRKDFVRAGESSAIRRAALMPIWRRDVPYLQAMRSRSPTICPV